MTLYEFLEKETPSYGGCMLCLARYKAEYFDFDLKKEVEKIMEEYMLVERHKISNGDNFTINERFFYDYDFTWDESMPWEILYKKEA